MNIMNMLQEYWTRFSAWFDFDAFLISVGGYTGILVIVASLLAIVLIVLSLRKPGAPAKAGSFLRKLVPSLGTVQQVARRLLETARYLFTSREWRYRSPWYLMVGSKDSGASTLGTYLQMIQRNNLEYREKQLCALGTEWFFLNEGIVINLLDESVTGEATEQAPGTQRPWTASLAELKQLRSERPVDGIVLAIPVDVLKRGSAQELQSLADELFLKLHTVQETFEFVLPVYIVITKCDLLKGFTHFWSVPDKACRSQIFGWSSPYRIDNNFELAWIDEAFTYVVERLKEIQLHSIALDNKALKEDSYYLYPAVLLPVKNRLKTVVENIFKSTKYQSNLLFRGIYFTGELSVDAAESTLPQAFRAQSVDTDGDGDADIPEIAFVKELFEQKIFREPNLARPSGKGVFSRDNYIRRFQIGMSAFAVFLFGMLAYKNAELDQQLLVIAEVVKMSDDVPVAGLANCSILLPASTTYPILASIAQVDDDLSTIFIPTSFRNDVPTQVAKALSNEGFEEIVFPNLICYLKQAGIQLNQPNAIEALTTEQRMTKYMTAVVDFEKNRARMEAIAPHALNLVGTAVRPEAEMCQSHEVRVDRRNSAAACESYLDAFIAINEYVFKEPVPPSLRRDPKGQHLKSLQASEFTFTWGEPLNDPAPGIPEDCRNQSGNEVPVSSRFGRPISQDLVLANLCFLALIHLSEIETNSLLEHYPVAGSAVDGDFIAAIDRDPDEALHAITEWLDYLNTEWLLPGTDSDPCGEMYQLLGDSVRQLTELYGYPEILFERILENFGDQSCTVQFLERVSQQNIPPLGQAVVATPTEGGTRQYSFAPAYAAIIPSLHGLRGLSYMELSDQRDFICSPGIETWDPAYLAQIITLYQEYENYAGANALPLTRDRNSLASMIAHDKLARVINQLLANAQQSGSNQFFTGATFVYRPVSGAEATISDKARKFDIVKNDLLQILGILRKLDMNATFTGLSQCARRYTLTVLDSVGNLVLDAQLYRKVPNAFSRSPSFASYQQLNGEGDLKEYLQDQHKRLALIAQYADPLVTFLLNTETVNGDNVRAEVMNFNYWNNTLREFNKFSQGIDQNNQLQKLDDYMTYMQAGIDAGNCTEADLSLPDTAQLGNDLFSSKRLDLQLRVLSSCNQSMALGFEQRYADLAARFNANLAGTYPFVQAGAPVLTEATPQAVRDFFTDYGGEMDTMVATTFLLGKADDQWKQIDEFLMRMITLRDFFTASLTAPANGKPLLLQFAFTRFRDYDSATNAYSQIASGTVRTGSMEVGFFAAPAVPAAAAAAPAPATLQWSFGDSLNVDLHWARDSEYVPVLTQGSHFAQDAADPYHLMFMEGGNWALPHLLESYRSGNGVLAALGETGTTVLEFQVTLRRTADMAADPAITTKTLLIPVTVLAQDAVTQAYQPTNLPSVYPSSAPPLTTTRRLTSNL